MIAAYEADPWGFVQRALNEKGWVEELSGLAEVQRRADEAADGLEWEEDDDDEGLEGEGEMV